MMQEYNFLRDLNASYLEVYASEVSVRVYGKYADKLLPQTHRRVPMKWDGIGIFINARELEWEYPKGTRPNSRWPWPLRLMRLAATVVVEGFEVYDRTNKTLLFRIPVSGLPYYLRPGDKLTTAVGNLKIGI